MKLKANYDGVIMTPVEHQQTKGGLYIPTDTEDTSNQVGEIISVGDGYYTATGQFIENTLKVGTKVIIPKMGFTKFIYEGDEYWIGKEREILAIIEPED